MSLFDTFDAIDREYLRIRLDGGPRTINDPTRLYVAPMDSGGGSGSGGNIMPMPMPMPTQQTPSTGAFFQSSRVPNMPASVASVEPPRQTARREMKGPSGVDDILKTFEEVRRQEVMGGMDNGMAGVGMAPPMMNNMAVPPAMNQPAVAAVMEMESLASGDLGSTTESTRTGGRRRRKAAITGNTLAVNV
jgi:hypothetical protein